MGDDLKNIVQRMEALKERRISSQLMQEYVNASVELQRRYQSGDMVYLRDGLEQLRDSINIVLRV